MNVKKFIIFVAIATVLVSILAGCSYVRGNGNLNISVMDTSGNPLWGAKVVSESQPEGQLKIDGITTEEAGGVVFNDIKAGKYQVQVSRYGYAPETLQVSVEVGKTQSVTVELFIASPPPVT